MENRFEGKAEEALKVDKATKDIQVIGALDKRPIRLKCDVHFETSGLRWADINIEIRKMLSALEMQEEQL